MTTDNNKDKAVALTMLKSSHYLLWAAQTKATLAIYNLSNLVLGEEPNPTPSANTTGGESTASSETEITQITAALRKSIADWERRNAIAVQALLAALPPEILIKVFKLTLASEIWTRLADEFGQVSEIRRNNAIRAWYKLEKSPSTPMSKHITEFERLQLEVDFNCTGSQNPLTLSDINLTFLLSLGPEWAHLRNNLGGRLHTMSTAVLFAEVMAEDEEKKLKDKKNTNAESPSTALYSNYRGNRPSNRPENNSDSSYKFNNPKQRKFCKYCKKLGHEIHECRKKKYVDNKRREENQGRSGPQNHQNSNSNNESFQARANIATCLSTVSHINNQLTWTIDSGANVHICPHRSRFNDDFQTLDHAKKRITGFTGNIINATGTGSITLTDENGNQHTLTDVLFVPDSKYSLLSMTKARKEGLHFEFTIHDEFSLASINNNFKLTGRTFDDILYVTERTRNSQAFAVTTRSTSKNKANAGQEEDVADSNPDEHTIITQPIRAPETPDLSATPSPDPPSNHPEDAGINEPSALWHLRLGHASTQVLSKIPGISTTNYDSKNCIPCILAKQTRLPFPSVSKESKHPLFRVYSDTCGPLPPSIGNSKYYITFTDEFTGFQWVYTMANKTSDTIKGIFETWLPDAANKCGFKLKYLRTDNGTEYQGALTPYLKSKGITHETSTPYSPQSNGIAERLNRTLNNMVRGMLFSAELPQSFWAEAVTTASYIKNRLPHSAHDDNTPYELFFSRKPRLNHLRRFGCVVYATIIKEQRPPNSKFSTRAVKGIFVGYKSGHQFKYYNLTKREFEFSHDITFMENDNATVNDLGDLHEASITSLNIPVAELELEPEERIVHDMIVVQPPPTVLSTMKPSTAIEPATYREATTGPEADKWKLAIEDEYNSLIENDTFTLCDLPPDRKHIGTKWVFKIKKDGKYKARLVAKGYSQIEGIDFDETFAPVVRIESVRHLFAIAAYQDLEILHVDAKTAFLNGPSDVDLYIEQPEGFVNPHYPSKVLKLNKSLYGLKQAPHIWHLFLCNLLRNYDLEPCPSDASIHLHKSKQVYVAVYVDDILVFGPDAKACNDVFLYLSKHVKMSNLGPVKSFLGLQVSRNDECISINQSNYIHKKLQEYNLTNIAPAKTPLDSSLPLLKAKPSDNRCNPTEYQAIIGSLNHLAVYSRPDIAFAVSQLSQFLSDPTTTHFKAAKQVLRYLKGTADFSITYGKAPNLNILAYADASWGNNKNDRKSTTGYIFVINNGAVSWTSHKQTTVALSTLEAEYMAVSDASREAIARHQLFKDLNIEVPAPELFSDNLGAIAVAQHPVYHQRSKHIDIRYHFIRNAIDNYQIQLSWVPTDMQQADILTKALGPSLHRHCLQLLRLFSSSRHS